MKSPILLDIPETFESDRLQMRCALPGDGPEIHTAVTETFHQIKQWFGPWAKEEPTPEESEEKARKSRYEFLERTKLSYNCYLKENKNLIGQAWFININWSVPKCNLAYWIRSSCQRKGFGFEAVQRFTSFGIEQIGFKRIELLVDPRNDPGLRLVKKLGYCLEGEIRNYSFDNFGIMRNYLMYSMIPDDYNSLKQSAQMATRESNKT